MLDKSSSGLASEKYGFGTAICEGCVCLRLCRMCDADFALLFESLLCRASCFISSTWRPHFSTSLLNFLLVTSLLSRRLLHIFFMLLSDDCISSLYLALETMKVFASSRSARIDEKYT